MVLVKMHKVDRGSSKLLRGTETTLRLYTTSWVLTEQSQSSWPVSDRQTRQTDCWRARQRERKTLSPVVNSSSSCVWPSCRLVEARARRAVHRPFDRRRARREPDRKEITKAIRRRGRIVPRNVVLETGSRFDRSLLTQLTEPPCSLPPPPQVSPLFSHSTRLARNYLDIGIIWCIPFGILFVNNRRQKQKIPLQFQIIF